MIFTASSFLQLIFYKKKMSVRLYVQSKNNNFLLTCKKLREGQKNMAPLKTKKRPEFHPEPTIKITTMITFEVRLIYLLLTHLFPMHPFSTP